MGESTLSLIWKAANTKGTLVQLQDPLSSCYSLHFHVKELVQVVIKAWNLALVVLKQIMMIFLFPSHRQQQVSQQSSFLMEDMAHWRTLLVKTTCLMLKFFGHSKRYLLTIHRSQTRKWGTIFQLMFSDCAIASKFAHGWKENCLSLSVWPGIALSRIIDGWS